MTVALVEFLTAQFDAEQRTAEAATDGPWRWQVAPTPRADSALYGTHRANPSGGLVMMTSKSDVLSRYNAAFIASWNPSRVLAEIKAKRAVLRSYEVTAEIYAGAEAVTGAWVESILHNGDIKHDARAGAAYMRTGLELAVLEGVLRDLAQPYEGQPGWRDEWKAEG